MMNPKEKAKELISKCLQFVDCGDLASIQMNNAKKIAIIYVDELIKHLPSSNGNPPNLQECESNSEWWEKVKQEIEKL